MKYAPVPNKDDIELVQRVLSMTDFDMEKWVEGLSLDELTVLESAALNNHSNPNGKVIYILKPYMKLIPDYIKLEEP